MSPIKEFPCKLKGARDFETVNHVQHQGPMLTRSSTSLPKPEEANVAVGSSLRNSLKVLDAKLYDKVNSKSKVKECFLTGLEQSEKINNSPQKSVDLVMDDKVYESMEPCI